jgi:hypothetical protein
MRELSLEEILFGLEEGKEYVLYGMDGILIKKCKFVTYVIRYDNIWIDFGWNWYPIYETGKDHFVDRYQNDLRVYTA